MKGLQSLKGIGALYYCMKGLQSLKGIGALYYCMKGLQSLKGRYTILLYEGFAESQG